MGRHVNHQDTSDLPFSYLIKQQSTTYIVPGANLKSVGTIRDAKKWPLRDLRAEEDRLDQINYNLLSPYVIRKMLNGIRILEDLQKASGENSETYSYQSGLIRRSSLLKGMKYYRMAIDKFLGNSLISRIMQFEFKDIEGLRAVLRPSTGYGLGDWMDMAGMIAPHDAVQAVLDEIENGLLTDVEDINRRFAAVHAGYYDYEWAWAYNAIEEYYGVCLNTITADKICELIGRWKRSVISLDELVYEDARKDFALSALTDFENNPFVASVREHIRVKSELGDTVLDYINKNIGPE